MKHEGMYLFSLFSYFYLYFIYFMQEQVFAVMGGNARKAIGASQDTAILMSASLIYFWNT